MIVMLKTGVPKLDDLLGGGIKENTSTALWASPGLDPASFVYQIINSQKSNVIYFTNSKKPELVKEEIESFGVSGKNLVFIDAYSPKIGVPTKEITVKNPKDPGECATVIKSTLKETGAQLVVFDSLSEMLDLSGEKVDIIAELKKTVPKGATVLFLFIEWPYDKKTIKKLQDSLDAIVEIKALEEKLFIKMYFGVSKISWAKPQKQAIPYRIGDEGIKVYFPKILVTGPFNSGKTSFVHSASTRAVSVDRLGTTIALDHGHVSYRGFSCDMFGTPGQERFDPILELLGGEALGVVVIISATDPASYDRAKEMVEKTKTTGLPLVVTANKADLRGALPDSAIRNAMGLGEDVQIVRMRAADLTKVQPGIPCQLKQEDIEKVLDVLFDRLLGGD